MSDQYNELICPRCKKDDELEYKDRDVLLCRRCKFGFTQQEAREATK